MRVAFIALLVSLCAPNHLSFAQEQQYEGKPIVRVEFVPLEQPLDARDLNAAQTLKPGEPLHKADVSAVIDRLFATGRYEDITADVQPSGNGVVVRFLTKKKNFIGHVGTQGKIKEPPNRGQIVNAAQLSLGQPFDPKDVDTGQKNIQDLLRRNGLQSSIGVSMFPSDGIDGQTLFFAADEALYHAKQGGKNAYRFFDRKSSLIAEKAAAVTGASADVEE